MPAIIAALMGGASFGQGMLQSRKQKKQRRRYGRRLGRALKKTESIQGKGLQQQEALTRLATEQQLKGFDVARREAERLGRGGKRRALEREQQFGASLSQGLASRGLGGTTVGANLSRGLAAGTSREMADIDEGLAGMFGNLALGRAGAEAGGTGALAGLARERGDIMSSLAQIGEMRDLFGSSPWGGGAPLPERENSFGQNLLGGFQTGLGAYTGMGGGGGGGQDQLLQYLFGGGGFGGGSSFGGYAFERGNVPQSFGDYY